MKNSIIYKRQDHVTSSYPKDSHHTNDRRINRNDSRLHLLQDDSCDREKNNGNVQLVPPGKEFGAKVTNNGQLSKCDATKERKQHISLYGLKAKKKMLKKNIN